MSNLKKHNGKPIGGISDHSQLKASSLALSGAGHTFTQTGTGAAEYDLDTKLKQEEVSFTDFIGRPVNYKTTGTLTPSSTTLVVADATGFAVDKWVWVDTGKTRTLERYTPFISKIAGVSGTTITLTDTADAYVFTTTPDVYVIDDLSSDIANFMAYLAESGLSGRMPAGIYGHSSTWEWPYSSVQLRGDGCWPGRLQTPNAQGDYKSRATIHLWIGDDGLDDLSGTGSGVAYEINQDACMLWMYVPRQEEYVHVDTIAQLGWAADVGDIADDFTDGKAYTCIQAVADTDNFFPCRDYPAYWTELSNRQPPSTWQKGSFGNVLRDMHFMGGAYATGERASRTCDLNAAVGLRVSGQTGTTIENISGENFLDTGFWVYGTNKQSAGSSGGATIDCNIHHIRIANEGSIGSAARIGQLDGIQHTFSDDTGVLQYSSISNITLTSSSNWILRAGLYSGNDTEDATVNAHNAKLGVLEYLCSDNTTWNYIRANGTDGDGGIYPYMYVAGDSSQAMVFPVFNGHTPQGLFKGAGQDYPAPRYNRCKNTNYDPQNTTGVTVDDASSASVESIGTVTTVYRNSPYLDPIVETGDNVFKYVNSSGADRTITIDGPLKSKKWRGKNGGHPYPEERASFHAYCKVDTGTVTMQLDNGVRTTGAKSITNTDYELVEQYNIEAHVDDELTFVVPDGTTFYWTLNQLEQSHYNTDYIKCTPTTHYETKQYGSRTGSYTFVANDGNDEETRNGRHIIEDNGWQVKANARGKRQEGLHLDRPIEFSTTSVGGTEQICAGYFNAATAGVTPSISAKGFHYQIVLPTTTSWPEELPPFLSGSRGLDFEITSSTNPTNDGSYKLRRIGEYGRGGDKPDTPGTQSVSKTRTALIETNSTTDPLSTIAVTGNDATLEIMVHPHMNFDLSNIGVYELQTDALLPSPRPFEFKQSNFNRSFSAKLLIKQNATGTGEWPADGATGTNGWLTTTHDKIIWVNDEPDIRGVLGASADPPGTESSNAYWGIYLYIDYIKSEDKYYITTSQYFNTNDGTLYFGGGSGSLALESLWIRQNSVPDNIPLSLQAYSGRPLFQFAADGFIKTGNILDAGNTRAILGGVGTGNRRVRLDFDGVSSATGSDYQYRISRNEDKVGANGETQHIHYGTGTFRIKCDDSSADVKVDFAGTDRLTVSNTAITANGVNFVGDLTGTASLATNVTQTSWAAGTLSGAPVLARDGGGDIVYASNMSFNFDYTTPTNNGLTVPNLTVSNSSGLKLGGSTTSATGTELNTLTNGTTLDNDNNLHYHNSHGVAGASANHDEACTAATPQTVKLPTTLVSSDNITYASGTGQFTVDTAGVYEVGYSFRIKNQGVGSNIAVDIQAYHGATEIVQMKQSISGLANNARSTTEFRHTSAIVNASASDTFQLNITCDTTGTVRFVGTDYQGFYVRRLF